MTTHLPCGSPCRSRLGRAVVLRLRTRFAEVLGVSNSGLGLSGILVKD